ncbi:MAG: hypothetical protein GY793_06065 [Proteobacteria bacterium]|nr:hypothetical protein [Pseudomonadota bacterium]
MSTTSTILRQHVTPSSQVNHQQHLYKPTTKHTDPMIRLIDELIKLSDFEAMNQLKNLSLKNLKNLITAAKTLLKKLSSRNLKSLINIYTNIDMASIRHLIDLAEGVKMRNELFLAIA